MYIHITKHKNYNQFDIRKAFVFNKGFTVYLMILISFNEKALLSN